MEAEQLNQMRTIVRLLNRAGHLNGRQGRAFMSVIDEYEILKNEKVQSSNTQKPKTGNNKTKGRPSTGNSS
jgi:hypothetical protein